MGKMNGRYDSNDNEFYYNRLMAEEIEIRKTTIGNDNNNTKLRVQIRMLVYNKVAVKRLLICMAIGFVVYFLYFKISYSISVFNINHPYFAVTIGAIIELCSSFICIPLVTCFGRKFPFIVLIQITVCMMLILTLTKMSFIMTFILSQLSKACCSSSIVIMFIYLPELSPTMMRSTSIAIILIFSRIGGMLAPTIDASMPKENERFMVWIYSAIVYCVLIPTLFLPETKGKVLPTTYDDIKKTNSKKIESKRIFKKF